MQHWGILTNNQSQTKAFVDALLQAQPPAKFELLQGKKGAVLSNAEIMRFMEKEERHEHRIITTDQSQSLKSMSSGERKKALLNHLKVQQPDFLVLVNPYDNLDLATQASLQADLQALSQHTTLIYLSSRKVDILSSKATTFGILIQDTVHFFEVKADFEKNTLERTHFFFGEIPPPLIPPPKTSEALVQFKNISVSFEGRQILQNINWTLKKGEFWNLFGPNGSGKTTLLKMITGDSHKGYGQDLTLFGHKKGTGESVWDIKAYIGYFTPSMTDQFRGYHTLENMLISGLHDSVGLYIKPSQIEKRLAHQWLMLLGLYEKRDHYFQTLTLGEKRLLLLGRAMVKHPPLLILDEPTGGLDDESTLLLVKLVNKMAQSKTTTIVFVSHRAEPELTPDFRLELIQSAEGSIEKIYTLE